MNPLEKLASAANRLVQIADAQRDRELTITLKEIASSVRGAVASIRAAIEGEAKKQPRPAKFSGVTGDEDPPSAKAQKKRKPA
jgi:hypothetical protein